MQTPACHVPTTRRQNSALDQVGLGKGVSCFCPSPRTRPVENLEQTAKSDRERTGSAPKTASQVIHPQGWKGVRPRLAMTADRAHHESQTIGMACTDAKPWRCGMATKFATETIATSGDRAPGQRCKANQHGAPWQEQAPHRDKGT